jgi:hypothetical protein
MQDEGTARNQPDAVTLSRLQDELRMLEEEIDQLRRTAEEARSRIGGRDEGATDVAERSTAIEQAEEQEALLGILTTRREQVQERLRTISGAGR